MSQERLKRLLNHNATDPNRVTNEVVDLQLATADALRTRLDAFGGVILGDEVGAGKTFVAFATLADMLLSQPGRGAAVFVPSGPLVHKWSQQMRDYFRAAVRDPQAGSALAERVVEMDRSLRVRDEEGSERRPRRGDIVVTQHSVFSRQTSDSDRAVCLERWIALRCERTRKPWSRLFAACELERWQANEDWAVWAGTDVLSSEVLRPIDAVFARWDAGDRALRDPLRLAVQEVRRAVGRKVLPDAELIIVDEAHNLRSASSQIYRSLMEVLHDRFDAMLFLTATPFQLGRDELRTIVEFFRSARGAAARAGDFDRRVVAMQGGMDGYVDALEAFGRAWRDLEAEEVGAAEHVCTGERALEPPAPARIEVVGQRFGECVAAKDRLESGLQPFLLRSVRKHHHREACGVDQIPAASRIPVALVDRLIAEKLAGRERVFVASALTSACSSWDALFSASITSGSDEREHSLRALSAMREEGLLGPHPKAQSTIDSCLEAVRAQEKALVFVERTETGRVIRDELGQALDRQRDEAARRRLQSPERFGWPSLRENYLHTLYPEVFGPPPSPELCREALEHPDIVALWRLVDREGEPRDYKVEKRLLEHATFRDAERREPGWRSRVDAESVKRCVENLLEPRYVLNGLDLRSGPGGDSLPLPDHPVRVDARPPNARFAAAYATYPSPWARCRCWLRQLHPDARADVVDAAAAAIATSHLQVEVDRLQAADDPATYFPQVHGLLTSDAAGWPSRFEAIAEQAADLAAGDRDHQEDHVGRLADALRYGERVQFVHGGTAAETKQRAIDGFNTPLDPEVLIATGVLGEGIDLHRSCRRVIHHDLPWNPAKLEQRTGRIDRIGSLASRLQAQLGVDADDAAIEVGLPYVAGTYDETIFRRVLARRREFRCLLGSRPEWESETPDVEESSAMSEAIVEALQVKLGPEADGEGPPPHASAPSGAA